MTFGATINAKSTTVPEKSDVAVFAANGNHRVLVPLRRSKTKRGPRDC